MHTVTYTHTHAHTHTHIRRVGQSRLYYMYAVYYRLIGKISAKYTMYIPFVYGFGRPLKYGFGQPW
jgi:hypothetical protein